MKYRLSFVRLDEGFPFNTGYNLITGESDADTATHRASRPAPAQAKKPEAAGFGQDSKPDTTTSIKVHHPPGGQFSIHPILSDVQNEDFRPKPSLSFRARFLVSTALNPFHQTSPCLNRFVLVSGKSSGPLW